MNLDKQILIDIKSILYCARNSVYSIANQSMVQAYWEIGKAIVEKQGGKSKAVYGDSLLKTLSIELKAEFGKGFTVSNLKI